MSHAIVSASADKRIVESELDDMFADLPPLDLFDLKKTEVATHLSALMSCTGNTRSSVAASLRWKKSRITQVLSGNGNPTIKTIFEFCSAIGYDFDIAFRKAAAPRVSQPWQNIERASVEPQPAYIPPIRLTLQYSAEVERDVLFGRTAPAYIRIDADDIHRNTHDVSAALQVPRVMLPPPEHAIFPTYQVHASTFESAIPTNNGR